MSNQSKKELANPKKMNPISRWLFIRKMKKKKAKFFKMSVGPDKYQSFLKEIEEAISGLIRDIPDTDLFLDRMGEESTRWLNDMPQMNMASFKAGVCYGIFTFTKAKQEKQDKKESYVV